jgi:Domain of unknown function (DUF6766)
MGIYVGLTVKLRQRGSAESKPLAGLFPQDEDPGEYRGDPHVPWPVRRGRGWMVVYKHSLSLCLLAMFLASLVLHAVTGSKVFQQ